MFGAHHLVLLHEDLERKISLVNHFFPAEHLKTPLREVCREEEKHDFFFNLKAVNFYSRV